MYLQRLSASLPAEAIAPSTTWLPLPASSHSHCRIGMECKVTSKPHPLQGRGVQYSAQQWDAPQEAEDCREETTEQQEEPVRLHDKSDDGPAPDHEQESQQETC